ncbi:hypothetical protein [Catellatospora citrea]|uniref:Uncharacterized protein n=1 Tax=Catellatospora citrea TaxID=53366 RepID=A0A8J3KBT8_9ACTN|nr:hypothetical protein [Catellatospora citrea]GIG00327.1 hypothetical protein Cci01nite_54200 [Catellatospora citrea]
MWGLEGYRPEPVTSVAGLRGAHGDHLRSLVGRRLTRIRGLCHVAEGDRCPTLPVVLELEGERLELATEGFDRLFVSRDDLADDLLPDTDDQDDPEQEVGWADLARAELDALLGATVTAVRVLEHDFRITAVDGGRIEAWVLGGLELVFACGRALQLANSRDALEITVEAPGTGPWRRTALDLPGQDQRAPGRS